MLTCGWWGPIYFIAYLVSPIKRVEVMAPPGTDPRIIEQMRTEAMQRTEADRQVGRRRLISTGVVAAIRLAIWIYIASTLASQR